MYVCSQRCFGISISPFLKLIINALLYIRKCGNIHIFLTLYNDNHMFQLALPPLINCQCFIVTDYDTVDIQTSSVHRITYTQWNTFEPNDAGNAEDRIAMVKTHSGWKWNDAPGNIYCPFICESLPGRSNYILNS